MVRRRTTAVAVAATSAVSLLAACGRSADSDNP
jgi:hypothetical protein